MKIEKFLNALPLAFAIQSTGAQPLGDRLFLEVWNGAADGTGKSYVRQLGMTMDAFMTAPGCLNGTVDLGSDANLAGLKSEGAFPPGTLWSVKAQNDGQINDNPQADGNHTGFLATVVNPDLLADPITNYPSFNDPMGALKSHIAPIDLDVSKAFSAADSGYFLNDGWGENMGLTSNVGFSVDSALGSEVGLYFLTVDPNDQSGVVGRNGQPLGKWRFDGQRLSFTATAGLPASPCSSPNPEPAPEPEPVPEPTTPGTSKPSLGQGSQLMMLLPKGGDVLKARVRQTVGWLSENIGANDRLSLFFSKDGGARWKLVKKGLRGNGYFLWRPTRRAATEQGVLAICVRKSKTSLPQCAATDDVFSVRK